MAEITIPADTTSDCSAYNMWTFSRKKGKAISDLTLDLFHLTKSIRLPTKTGAYGAD
jgi:hypothetical protein